jgi:sigma54-dependent transcription regulator
VFLVARAGFAVVAPRTPMPAIAFRIGSTPIMGEKRMIDELAAELASIETRKIQIQKWVAELPYLDSRKQEIEIVLDFMDKRSRQQSARQAYTEGVASAMSTGVMATSDDLLAAANAAPKIVLEDLIVVGMAVLQTGGPVHVLEDVIAKLKFKSEAAGRGAEVRDLLRKLEVKVQTKRDFPKVDRFNSVANSDYPTRG